MAEHCKISAAMHAISLSEERSYVLKVDGYSRAKALLKNDEYLTSDPFIVGGHDWVVRYYPNGANGHDDFISLYLQLESDDAEDVKAKFTISVLDKNGELVPSYRVPSYSDTHPVDNFSSKGDNWGFHNLMKKADLEASAHIRDDCLTIRCDVTVIHHEETRVPPSDLHQHLGDLLMSKDAADLTFHVGREKFSAHRCVLASRSSVFKTELLGAMKESSSASPIEICDMEADVFKSLLHFIYTDSVPTVLDVVTAGHLLVAADRYNIVRLKLICEEKLCNRIDSNMVATILVLAEQHGFHRLKEACLQFLASPSNFKARWQATVMSI